MHVLQAVLGRYFIILKALVIESIMINDSTQLGRRKKPDTSKKNYFKEIYVRLF